MTTDDTTLIRSWLRSKRAGGCADRTIESYRLDGEHYLQHLAITEMTLAESNRGDVEEFLAGLVDRGLKPATVARHYRSLVQLYRWLDEEEELQGRNPMAKMRAPIVPEQPPDIITTSQYERLLEACETPRSRAGKYARPDRPTFENRRDVALLRMLWTTGIRASEIMGLRVTDVDLGAEAFTVMGKGRKARTVTLTPKTSLSIDRYVRARGRHKHHALPGLWLGEKGELSVSGLQQMLDRRCEDAGLEHINPHRFRHTFAHTAKSRGMTDGDLMNVAGWTTPAMLHRYGKSAAGERARESHRSLFSDD